MTEGDLAYCTPLQADDGTLPSILKVDAINNGAHIDCQWRERGLVDAVRKLIAAGVLTLTTTTTTTAPEQPIAPPPNPGATP